MHLLTEGKGQTRRGQGGENGAEGHNIMDTDREGDTVYSTEGHVTEREGSGDMENR